MIGKVLYLVSRNSLKILKNISYSENHISKASVEEVKFQKKLLVLLLNISRSSRRYFN